MKVYQIQAQQQNVQTLLDYCKENKIKNMHLNLVLLSNFETLSKEMTLINKCVDPELTVLETKAHEIAKDKKDFDYRSLLSLLSKDDKEKHDKLMVGYNELRQEDRIVTLEVIDRSKLVQAVKINEVSIVDGKEVLKEVTTIIPLEFGIDESATLKFFFDAKNWEKVRND